MLILQYAENTKRLTKKALLLLRLPEKYSFTFSKLRFFGLRKPKNSSFYPTSLQTWVTHFTFGSPTSSESIIFHLVYQPAVADIWLIR